MATATTQTKLPTFGDLLERLGNISPHRICLDPAPGQATAKDVLDILNRTDRLYELVDGVLVEKVMGYPESSLASRLIKLLGNFLDRHDLGNLAGPDGTLRLMPNLIRIPDISFVRWEKLPSRKPPSEPIPNLVPDVAVEIVSTGNTPGEMNRKLREYFRAGVRLVWLVEMPTRTVRVYTSLKQSVVLGEDDTLDGGDVLSGLALPVRQIFARVPREPDAPTTGKSKPTPRRKPPRGDGRRR